MAGKKQKTRVEDANERTVCRNRRARHDYEILEEVECGLVLTGSEVKSIRDNKVSIDEAYARVENGEVWLFQSDIGEYPQATYLNHARLRPRKLLLNKREIRKFAEAAQQEGMTLIPLALYFKRGYVKIKLAAARGRKHHDKRDRLRKEEAEKTIRAALRKRS